MNIVNREPDQETESGQEAKYEHEHEQEEALRDSIESLEERITKTNSLPQIFLKGILNGLGSVIGATLVFAILVSLFSWFLATTDSVWVHDFLEAVGLSDFFNKENS
jgi:hypothetical protein